MKTALDVLIGWLHSTNGRPMGTNRLADTTRVPNQHVQGSSLRCKKLVQNKLKKEPGPEHLHKVELVFDHAASANPLQRTPCTCLQGTLRSLKALWEHAIFLLLQNALKWSYALSSKSARGWSLTAPKYPARISRFLCLLSNTKMGAWCIRHNMFFDVTFLWYHGDQSSKGRMPPTWKNSVRNS